MCEDSGGCGAGVTAHAAWRRRRLADPAPGAAAMHRSQGEIEAAVCDAVARFQQEYMGRGPQHVHAHLVDNRVFVHLEGVLTAAERRLLDGAGTGNGRGADLLKQLRSHLVLAGRPVLEALVRDAAGAAPISVHHDISPVTGEEVIVLTLASAPATRDRKRR